MFGRMSENNNVLLIVLVIVVLLYSNGEGMKVPKEMLYIGVGVVLFFLLKQNSMERFGPEEKITNLEKVDTNICSPVCCGTQWPTSVPLPQDDRLKGKEYASTNFTCSGKKGTGCVCSTGSQMEFLSNRGNNA